MPNQDLAKEKQNQNQEHQEIRSRGDEESPGSTRGDVLGGEAKRIQVVYVREGESRGWGMKWLCARAGEAGAEALGGMKGEGPKCVSGAWLQ